MNRSFDCPCACLQAGPLFVSFRLTPPAPIQYYTHEFLAPVHLRSMTSPKRVGQFEQQSMRNFLRAAADRFGGVPRPMAIPLVTPAKGAPTMGTASPGTGLAWPSCT